MLVVADPADCSFQFNPVGTAKFTNSCDIAKGALARASVIYREEDAPPGTIASIKVGDKTMPAYRRAEIERRRRPPSPRIWPTR